MSYERHSFKNKVYKLLKHIVLLVYYVCTKTWKCNLSSNEALYGVTTIEDNLRIMIIKV